MVGTSVNEGSQQQLGQNNMFQQMNANQQAQMLGNNGQ
jgi:hypothetical protein